MLCLWFWLITLGFMESSKFYCFETAEVVKSKDLVEILIFLFMVTKLRPFLKPSFSKWYRKPLKIYLRRSSIVNFFNSCLLALFWLYLLCIDFWHIIFQIKFVLSNLTSIFPEKICNSFSYKNSGIDTSVRNEGTRKIWTDDTIPFLLHGLHLLPLFLCPIKRIEGNSFLVSRDTFCRKRCWGRNEWWLYGGVQYLVNWKDCNSLSLT